MFHAAASGGQRRKAEVTTCRAPSLCAGGGAGDPTRRGVARGVASHGVACRGACAELGEAEWAGEGWGGAGCYDALVMFTVFIIPSPRGAPRPAGRSLGQVRQDCGGRSFIGANFSLAINILLAPGKKVRSGEGNV